MKQRIITAVIALVLFVPVVYYGGWLLQVVTAILAVIGVFELFRMKGLELLSLEGALAILGTLSLVVPLKEWFPFLPKEVTALHLFYIFVMALLALAVFSKNTYSFEEAAFPALVSLYVGMGFGSFLLARSNGFEVLMYALFIVWATDIGAYQFGSMYGKNKLAESISPNKTIEGSIGGILSAVVVALLYFIAVPAATTFHHSVIVMMFLTVIFSVFGQFGDLVESAYKRHFGVKDSGKLLPGHGGILDRFDSLLFVFPIMHVFGLF